MWLGRTASNECAKIEFPNNLKYEGEAHMNITTVGIDLTKDIITVYAQDEAGLSVYLITTKWSTA